MKEEPDSLSIPYNFARCFNNQCPQATQCLRQLAARHNTADEPCISIINPMCFPTDGNNCPHFKNDEKIRVAWGTKHLLNRIPHEDAVSIRKQLIWHFGKSGYYRFYREERYLTPKEQNFIKQAFRNKGITTEPTFERYTEEYIW